MLFCLHFIMKLYTISPNILYTILPVHTLVVARVGHGRKPKLRQAGGETPPLRTSRNNGVGATLVVARVGHGRKTEETGDS